MSDFDRDRHALVKNIAATLAVKDARIKELEAALKHIDRATTEWDANKLGGVHIQRKRWQRCGEIARNALENGGAS